MSEVKALVLNLTKIVTANSGKPKALINKITDDAVKLKSGDRLDDVKFISIDEKDYTVVKNSSEVNIGSNNNQMASNSVNSNNNLIPFTEEVLKLTNDFRVKNGRSRLTMNSDLSEAAQDHSEDMAKLDFFSHTGKDGSKAGDRITDAGYEWNTYGENIAAGQRTPDQVVQGWINSPGHRANMLNPNFKELGVGYFFLKNDTGNVN
ncbi:MAG: CAP domain-containing protein, partial [Cyanobacteria bacterium P01_A01_bin.84]